MSAPTDPLDSRYVVSTVAVVVLATVSSLLGLFRVGHYDVDPAVVLRLRAQDAVILLVAVPVLAVALWYVRRGSLCGRVVWLGGLAYMTYMWASVAGTTPFNEFFLGYVALFGVSLFTLVGGVVHTDPDAVYRALHGRVGETVYGGFLGLVAVGLAALWLADIVPATVAGTRPLLLDELGEQATHTYVLDLGVVVPSLAITAVWIQRSRPWGYLFAGVLLVMAALLAPSLTAITVVDATGGFVTLTTPLIAGTIVPPLVAAMFAAKYLLALRDGDATGGVAGERRIDA